jgi:hypothetical protein
VAPRRPKPHSLNTHSPQRWYRQRNQRLAPTANPLYARAAVVSPCILYLFVACHPSLVSHLSIVPGVMRTTRRQKCTALRPQRTHATPLPLTRQPRVGEPAKTRRRCRLPPAVAPSQTKTPKTRDLFQNRPSITQESKLGHLGLCDIQGAPISCGLGSEQLPVER